MKNNLRRRRDFLWEDKRPKALAEYIIEKNATVRDAAKAFSVSKSTVHKDITANLSKIDHRLFERVNAVLQKNKAERHLRGGKATKEKYLKNQNKER